MNLEVYISTIMIDFYLFPKKDVACQIFFIEKIETSFKFNE